MYSGGHMKDNILGFDVLDTSYNELLKNLFKDINQKYKNFVVNINPFIIMNFYNNKKIIAKFNQEKYQIADGIGIVWASKLNQKKLKERITGIDLMEKICSKAAKETKTIFLCGAGFGVAEKTKLILENKYKNIKIVGTCSGYISEKEMMQQINGANADIVFIALGSPKQEMFILNNKDKLKYKVIMPVGGSFDVISGNIKRAPKLFIKTNTEWLYRTLREPKRLKKNLILFKFIFLVIFKSNKNGGSYKCK